MGKEEEEKKSKRKITKHTDLDVYNLAFDAAMEIFRLSMNFPIEERYSLTDQIRRASRSVSANIAEGWNKRRYPAAFISKLADSAGEAGETEVWLQFAVKCSYLEAEQTRPLYNTYDEIIAKLVNMQINQDKWTFPEKK